MGARAGQTEHGPGSLANPGAPRAVGRQARSTDIRLLAAALLAGLLILCALPALPSKASLLPLWGLALWRFPGRALYLALVLGLSWGTLQGHWLQSDRLPEARHGEIRWVTGHIDSLPELSPRRARFELATTTMPGRLRVSWYGEAPALRAGQCWRMKLKLSTPRGSANPGTFDYEAWLWRERIGATAYVREARPCAANRISVDTLRQAAAMRLDSLLPDSPATGIIRAIALGDRGGISDAQWEIFRRTGTSHLIAISGLHIGLIWGMSLLGFRWLFGRVRAGSRVPAVLTAAAASLCLAGLYAAMAGFALPTQRAFLAVSIVCAALWLRRSMLPSQLLALALIAVLLFDPFAPLAPGFWLSFGAVAWILYLLSGRIGGAGRLRAWLLLQPALVLALAPLTLFWFGEASVVAPLANAVLVPAFVLVVPIVLMTVICALVLPAAGGPLLQGVAWPLEAGLQCLALLADVPMSHVTLAAPDARAVATACVGLLLLFAPRGLPFRWLGLVGLLPLLLVPARPGPGEFRAHVIDVGQGLSVLVQTQGHDLLFDAGPRFPGGFNAGEAIVNPFLAGLGIRQLDAFVLSHDDIDHRGGQAAVTARFDPVAVYGNGIGAGCEDGMAWSWDGVRFAFLHPPERAEGNDGSCVLLVSSEAGRLLLTGDIERPAEQRLVDEHANRLASDVMLVPHHGSATSSSAGFLKAVDPAVAVVSAGWRNRWGFPRPDVVARYERQGASLLNTAEAGAIRLSFSDEDGLSVQRWRAHAPAFWRAP